jgi:hypothetical protein
MKVSLLLTYEQQNEIQSSTRRPATVGLLLLCENADFFDSVELPSLD